MKEEFKTFVRKRPYLAKYVNNGSMTWQKFYEQWSLYGEEESVWSKYKETEEKKDNKETFNFSSVSDMIKKIDVDSVQKGINSLQKIIELFQGFTLKDANKINKDTYEPRQLFKKFED